MWKPKRRKIELGGFRMLEKEYLVCFVISSERGTTYGDVFVYRNKVDSVFLKCLREKIKEEFKEKNYPSKVCNIKVVFTNIVCLGEVEDE